MLKKCVKTISLLFFTLAMVLSCTLGAAAAEKRGSISVTLHTKEKKIPAGTLTLYRIAVPRDGVYDPVKGFRLFKDQLDGITSEELGDPELAENLRKHAKNNKIEGTPSAQTAEAEKDIATVKFDDLEPGLYLVVQTKSIKGFQDISPFLVTIPYKNEYHVDAKSKFEQHEPGHKPPDGGGGGGHNGGGGGKKPPLIQTGQLNWPVPVLAGSGMVLFMLGWMLVFGKRERHDA